MELKGLELQKMRKIGWLLGQVHKKTPSYGMYAYVMEGMGFLHMCITIRHGMHEVHWRASFNPWE